tara:strand:+ start:8383 stop:9264 length:882 start_codon:yes stop_codon:yes gene_type:complete
MEIIKRKISLDEYTSRKKDNWGQITATTFSLNVFFTQNGYDMGIGTETSFIAKDNSTIDPATFYEKAPNGKLLTKLASSDFKFKDGTRTSVPINSKVPNTRNPNKITDDYYISGGPVTGLTEDRLDVVTSYSNTDPYQIDIDIDKNIDAIDYQNTSFVSGTRVKSNDDLNPITYLIDGDNTEPSDLSKPEVTRGVYYVTKTDEVRTVLSQEYGLSNIPFTEMYYNSEGFNQTNVELNATTKEEYLFGITSTPTVFSDLFIDRGRTTVLQSHMQLGEIKNMEDLINYGNGFYNL